MTAIPMSTPALLLLLFAIFLAELLGPLRKDRFAPLLLLWFFAPFLIELTGFRFAEPRYLTAALPR